MSTACLNGLTATYRQQVVATNTVDFTKLQPQDVERLVPTNQLDIDWSAVIFIKNCRRRKAIADTVVWTEQGGFYRTRQSPRALINQVVETSIVQWLDMRAMVDYLELSGPLPYVMGRIMLVSTERPADGNQTSWVGCWSVSHMNPTTRQHQVSLLLTNGMTMIIRDTVSRLRKKIAEAHQILVFSRQTKHTRRISTSPSRTFTDRLIRSHWPFGIIETGGWLAEFYVRQAICYRMKSLNNWSPKFIGEIGTHDI